MTTKPAIIWEKWFDPLGGDDQDLEDDDEIEDLADDDIIDGIGDPIDKSLFKYKNSNINKCRIIMTPFGIIPYNENTASSKIFNFWMGHSNFGITSNISDIIEKIDGVETLDVFTRYRFRIAIGKAFQDSEVMRIINKNVYNYIESL